MISSENSPALVAGGVSKESNNMATVKITRSTVAGGFDVKEGQTYELDDADALALIRMGKAVPVEAKAKKPAENRGEVKTTARVKRRAD